MPARPVIEVEFPRGFLRGVMLVIVIVALIATGYFITPAENGRPVVLSPRIIRVIAYQHDVRRWAADLKTINFEFIAVLHTPSVDLFEQDRRINRAAGFLTRLSGEVEHTDVPPTLEPVRQLMNQTLGGYLAASSALIQWVGEPTEENHKDAMDAVDRASQMLARLNQTPWMSSEKTR